MMSWLGINQGYLGLDKNIYLGIGLFFCVRTNMALRWESSWRDSSLLSRSSAIDFSGGTDILDVGYVVEHYVTHTLVVTSRSNCKLQGLVASECRNIRVQKLILPKSLYQQMKMCEVLLGKICLFSYTSFSHSILLCQYVLIVGTYQLNSLHLKTRWLTTERCCTRSIVLGDLITLSSNHS